MEIFRKIQSKEAQVAVIGLGYVGLPLAVESAKAGFRTLGIDLAEGKVDAINQGKNYIGDVDDTVLAELVQSKTLSATTDFSRLAECDFISICVPTPLGKGKVPDISFIIAAVTEVRNYLRKEQVIILESTTYPGTTAEVVLPILAESGLKVGEDFFLAFSPERIDPGNAQYGLKNTPKVIGGMTSACTETAVSLYQTFIDKVIPVSSAESAEMVKILENTFRAINIGLANEIAIMCHRMGIDVWEVIQAASSKPFGFMPFYPGPGLGGHCIPVDPHYLVWKLKTLNYTPRFIQLADEINSSMPDVVIDRVTECLNDMGKSLRGSKVLVVGVAYKKNVSDMRESPALTVIQTLLEKGADVSYHDPFVAELTIEGQSVVHRDLENVGGYDCLVILTDHSNIDYDYLMQESQAIVDTRNVLPRLVSKTKIVRL